MFELIGFFVLLGGAVLVYDYFTGEPFGLFYHGAVFGEDGPVHKFFCKIEDEDDS